jgi:hypothetical protein
MSFFQNPFNFDFRGNWILGDRQQALVFECKRNAGRTEDMVSAWNSGPYDLSSVDSDGDSSRYLKIKFTIDMEYKVWNIIAADLGTDSATTVDGIISTLNADPNFATFFIAYKQNDKLFIKQKLAVHRFRFFIMNGTAEEKLGFNKRAGVAELPTYFARHEVENVDFLDGNQCLIALDTSNNVDKAVIDNAVDEKGNSLNYDSSTIQEDWQLLKGRSGIFHFQKCTIDGSDRITEIIEYPAGSVAGALARKINYEYTGGNTKPSNIWEVPYTLQSGDLITPP